MLQQLSMRKLQAVMLFIIVVIIVRDTQKVARKILERRQLLVAGQHVISSTYPPTGIDIGEGVVKHLGIRRGRFIRHDANRAVHHPSIRQHPHAEYQPRDRKIQVLFVAVSHIGPQLWIPKDDLALGGIHGNMQAVLR